MAKQKGAQKSGINAKALVPEKKRNRITLGFQLDFAKDNVEAFLAIKAYLSSQRSWKRYLMDGLRLFYDLKGGSTAVLLELFPNIRDMLAVGQGDNGLKDDIAELKRMLREAQIAQPIAPTGGFTMAAQPAPPTTGKLLTGKSFALPVFDDDEDEFPTLKLSKNTSNTGSMNFLRGLSDLH